jgi:predicted metal-dependent hydrolase
MMSTILKIILSIVSSELPLDIRRVSGAKRWRLTIDPRRRRVRLTLGPRASLTKALSWAEAQRDWIASELAKLPLPRQLAAGTSIPIDGIDRLIIHDPGAPRNPQLDAHSIRLGGPEEQLGPRLLRWLKQAALQRLRAETEEYAALAGLPIPVVGVGDPQRRWGSCSSRGVIRYSWRLILMPTDVRRSIVAHEVAHLSHMNHSPAFHAQVAKLFGRAPLAEQNWLKANSTNLHRWIA